MNDKVNRAYINGFGVSFGPSGYELEVGADEETQTQAEALYGKKSPAEAPAEAGDLDEKKPAPEGSEPAPVVPEGAAAVVAPPVIVLP